MADQTNLFVGSLPDGMTDALFRQLFEVHGTIVSTKLVPERRHGFVRFSSNDEAQRAIQATNGAEFSGSTLVVKVANSGGQRAGAGAAQQALGELGSLVAQAPEAPKQSDNLYIKGLPASMTEQQLLDIFGAYGQVVSSRILEPQGVSADGVGETVALVRFANTEQAAWLVENLNGNIPQGLEKPVQVKFAQSGKGRNKGAGKGLAMATVTTASHRYSPYGKGGHYAAPVSEAPPNLGDAVLRRGVWDPKLQSGADRSHLYVKDLPPTASDLYLYKVFAPFGAVQSVRAAVQPDGQCSGIGFVKFASQEDARKALIALNVCTLPDGATLQVSVKTERRAHPGQQ